MVNFVPVPGAPSPLTPENIEKVNAANVALTSVDDPQRSPAWQQSRENIPDPRTRRSNAPITLITVDKGNGVLDAYYMYFYAFNHGNAVLGRHYGNHVGDWEYNVIRFKNGVPQSMWFSEHSGGEAYEFRVVKKTNDGRPITFVAVGSHANYANNGLNGDHPYTLPLGLLKDRTSGSGDAYQWDVALNYRAYCFSNADGFTEAAGQSGLGGMGWLKFTGTWGDDQYPKSDPRQYELFGQWHYGGGPTGPVMKNIDRPNICPDAKCTIHKLNLPKLIKRDSVVEW
ncbi:hypothetical protein HK104_001355 [Borealophlyctis nickersoniae]|nr:hypothetical protein HK104_001355 [Borealophlyctis nickersoniae]